MAQPVWTLSVDLQTKTATFQTGMADAARSAKDAFKGIKEDADGMAEGVRDASGKTNYSMMEARHGVMMLGEEFGVHLPRGLTTFIASLGPVGAAMEAAFPFLAIILGATLLIEHLEKLKAKGEELTASQTKSADTIRDIFDRLGDEMLQVGIRADELAGDHLDALHKQLMLIDRQTMSGIIGELDKLGKDADEQFSKLQSNWFMQLVMGRADVGPAKAQLAGMIAEINKLKGTGADPGATSSLLGTDIGETKGKIDAIEAQMKQLRAERDAMTAEGSGGALVDERQLERLQQQKELYQQNLSTLQTMHDVAAQSVNVGAGKKKNDRDAEAKRAEADQEKLAEAQQRGADKRLMIEAAYNKKVTEERKKEAEEAEKMAALELSATESVTKEVVEQEKEKSRITAELGKEEAEHAKKMASLSLQAEEASTKDIVKAHKHRSEQILEEQIAAEDAEYQAAMRAYQMELSTLDRSGKDYEVKLQQLNDKELELTKEHENKLTQIKEQAAEERNARVLAAEHKMADDVAGSLTKALMGQETWAKMSLQLGRQVAAGLMENAVKSVLANDYTKESDAAHAARNAYLEGQKIGGPAGMIVGAAMGAMAFASVMAFAEGGIVPGVERGDVVPTMLTPGEAVLPKKMTENLSHAPTSNKQPDIHVHHHATYNLHAIDTDGVRDMLDKHADTFAEHVHKTLRTGNHH